MRSRSRTDSTRSRGPPSSGSFRRPTARSGSSSRPTRKPGSWCTRRAIREVARYASVVGVGTLHRVDLDDLTPETIAQYGKTQRPLFEIWADGKEDLDIELYRFEPKRLTGRTVVVDRDEA